MVARMSAGVFAVTAVAALALTGCANMERPATTQVPTTYAGPPIAAPSAAAPSAAAPAAPSAAAPSTATSTAPAAPAGKVSASTATEDELVRALIRAGVSTPGQWADQIVANRPYPATDTSLAKLRAALTKAGATSDVVNKIASALTP